MFLSAIALAFAAGWGVRGGRAAAPLRVETERTLAVRVTALPAPTPTPEREKINVNTAGVEELMTLPGIGAKRAADIVHDREVNGPYRIPEDITRIKGIGEETLGECIEYITAGEAEP